MYTKTTIVINSDLLLKRIETLDLSARSLKWLRKAKIFRLSELVQKTECELRGIKNLGKKSVDEIKQRLSTIGLELDIVIPDFTDIKKGAEITCNIKKLTQTRNMRAIKYDAQTAPLLLRKIDDIQLSCRTANCLRKAKIKFIAELVSISSGEILNYPNFGRKSLKEVQTYLSALDLDLGMNVEDWPPKKLSNDLKKVSKNSSNREAVSIIEKDNLEDQSFYICQQLFNRNSDVKRRNCMIFMQYYGFDGNGPRTLEDVGRENELTRERVRQICSKEEKAFRKYWGKVASVPAFQKTIEFILGRIPNFAEQVERDLCLSGLTKGIFRLEGLISVSKILGQEPKFCVGMFLKHRFALPFNQTNLPKKIIIFASKFCSSYGVGNTDDLVAELEEYYSATISQSLVISVLNLFDGFDWLDDGNTWFWKTSKLSRNRLHNVTRKIVSVAGQIHISDLRNGILRVHRMGGYAPPKRVLLKFCKCLSWCKVEGEFVSGKTKLDWEEEIGSNEWALVEILKSNDSVMRASDLEKECLEVGMNYNSYYQYLCYSPILQRLAQGVYGLRGAKIHPCVIENLTSIPRRRATKVIVDYGWSKSSNVWLALKLSQGIINSGVFSVPAAIKRFIPNEAKLVTKDGAKMGVFKMKNSSAWSLKTFLKRRGGEVGDYVLLNFDFAESLVTIQIVDLDSVETFKEREVCELYDGDDDVNLDSFKSFERKLQQSNLLD